MLQAGSRYSKNGKERGSVLNAAMTPSQSICITIGSEVSLKLRETKIVRSLEPSDLGHCESYSLLFSTMESFAIFDFFKVFVIILFVQLCF